MKPTLCVDVDSTIWNTAAWICEAFLETTGEKLDVNEITTWTHLLNTYGEETTTIVFDRVFDTERIHERGLYPGATGVLRALQENQGLEIHFVTHNDPEIWHSLLKPWLQAHFGPQIALTVTRGDKLEILQDLGAIGLIDDRPDTIERVADAGLWAATKLQPWNRDLVSRRGDIHGFDHWHEVPALLTKPESEPDEAEGESPAQRAEERGLQPDAC